MFKKVGIVVIVALTLALVAPAAAPVQVSFVTSDSMEPAIQTNDGYILLPAGEVIPGEIVTFYSDDRSGYVTHRVVGTTTDGYLTKGDANPSTDQEAGSPPVERDSITGQVLTVGGQPVVIPKLGALVGAIRANWMLSVALVGLGLLMNILRGPDGRKQDPEGSVLRSREVIMPALLVAIVASVFLISSGAVHADLEYSVTETGSGDPRVLTVGESTTTSLNASILRTPLTVAVVDTDGIAIEDDARARISGTDVAASAAPARQPGTRRTLRQRVVSTSEVTLNATIPAQAEPGSHTAEIGLYPYPATLPKSTLKQLHTVHPWLAALGSVLVMFLPSYVFYWLLIDPTTRLRGSRRRWLNRLGDR